MSFLAQSSPIIPIDSHVLVAKIAEPVNSLFTTQALLTLLTTTQVNNDLQILLLENDTSALLIDLFRLTVDKQLEHGTPIHRLEADARTFRDDCSRGYALCVPDRAEDTAPVGVAAVEGGLDERGPGDGGGDETGGLVVWGVLDAYGDELGGAFAVADDELRERLRERGEDVLHGGVVVRGGGADGGAAGGAVGENGDRVVCACVAVDGDGVEGARDGVHQEGLQGGGVDGGVGAEDAEEGGHVRVDHAGAFGHAGEAVGAAGGRGEGEGSREQLGEGVCCADGAGGGEPGVVGGCEAFVCRGDFVKDLGDGESGRAWLVRFSWSFAKSGSVEEECTVAQ